MFEGKVVWVTGASSGIGKAFAEALHAQNAKVVLSAYSEEELKPVHSQLSGSVSLPFDLADFDAFPRHVDEAIGAFGQVDLLINNAGITQRSLAKDTSFDVYQRIIGIDLMAPIALTQSLMPHMRARGTGRVIAVSSLAGKYGAPLRTAYCAAKHGMFGYFDALRTEVSHDGIDIHVIASGAVKTNLARNALTGEGANFGRTDAFIEGGYDADEFVNRALKAIANGKREIIIARGLELMAYRLRRFLPEKAFDRIAKATPDAVRQLEATAS
ncbi:SDR family NAD(P)-dependent oxidoreductase [Ruegeria jejuensis]|uniref:SDR family NAD(P)-dependent oxidoreductase n=1 Tax=Ruegeria jejuensis TaxID=3233338 RepID=UPI00355B9470